MTSIAKLMEDLIGVDGVHMGNALRMIEVGHTVADEHGIPKSTPVAWLQPMVDAMSSPHIGPDVFRQHCEELCKRHIAGEELAPPTAQEINLIVMDHGKMAALRYPLDRASTAVMARAMDRVFGERIQEIWANHPGGLEGFVDHADRGMVERQEKDMQAWVAKNVRFER